MQGPVEGAIVGVFKKGLPFDLVNSLSDIADNAAKAWQFSTTETVLLVSKA